jgi:hypothetical protein
MTKDEQNIAAYREMISNLSDELPRHGLEPKDIHLKPEQLRALLNFHDAAQTVCDGIESESGFDALADVMTTTTDDFLPLFAGIIVSNSILRYAAKLAWNDVLAIRDETREIPLHTNSFYSYGRA